MIIFCFETQSWQDGDCLDMKDGEYLECEMAECLVEQLLDSWGITIATLTGEKYRDNILRPVVIPHFDNHPLRTRPVYLDDHARPHRARVVMGVIQHEAITTLPWTACSPKLNPIEHLWDILGRRIHRRDPPVQNVVELDAALHEEWQQIQQNVIQRLIRSMSRRVREVINIL